MKILVRLPNWLGDVVMSTAFVKALAANYPNAEIHLIIKKELAGIGELISTPHQLHLFSKKEFKGAFGAYKFGKQLQKFNFDLFFSLPNSFSAALMGFATKAKIRVGFGGDARFFLLTKTFAQPKQQHRVLDYISLLEQFTQKKLDDVAVSLTAEKIDLEKKLILINFNSEAVSRRMPLEKGKSILASLLHNFPNANFGLIGSPKEREFVQSFINFFPDQSFTNYAGKTDFKTLVNLMASASFMLSTDSGPAHVANSTYTPLLVLFGAGNENNTAPFNKKKLHTLRLGKLSCEPCVKNICIYGLPKCLEELDNHKIVETAKTYV